MALQSVAQADTPGAKKLLNSIETVHGYLESAGDAL
jgi:hypothetical protein